MESDWSAHLSVPPIADQASVPHLGGSNGDITDNSGIASLMETVQSAPSMLDFSIPFASQVLYPTKDEWELQRGLIEDLYVKQGMKLEDARQFMAREHKFFASANMFKKRIKQWGMDKKHLKHDEVGAVVLRKRQRDAVQKQSKIIIRGRQVEWKEIQRHLSRNPALQAKLDRGALELGSSAARVLVRTPSPDPAQAPSIRLPLAVGGDLQAIEDLSRILIGYFEGAMDSGTWIIRNGDLITTSQDPTVRFLRWHKLGDSAVDLLRTGNTNSAFRLLNRWLDHLPRVFRDQHHNLIPILLRLLFYGIQLCYMKPSNSQQLEKMILDHITCMSKVVLGAHHPFSMFWSRLQREPRTSSRIYLYRILVPLLDLFSDRFQAASFRYLVKVEIIQWQQCQGDYGSAMTGYREILKDCSSNSKYDRQYFGIQIQLCNVLLRVGRLDEAETLLHDASQSQVLQLLELSFSNIKLYMDYQDRRAEIRLSRGDVAGALRVASNLVEWCKQGHGASHSDTLQALGLHVNILNLVGRYEDAHALNLEIDKAAAGGVYEID